jgi:two-component system cell cycle response regulator
MAKGRLLAIDDKPFYQRFYKNLFEDDGYSIHVVDSVEAGLEALNRESFDLVIADLALNEIKGLELVVAIQQFVPQQEILIITGQQDVTLAVQALKIGVVDYLMKPVNPEELLMQINRILLRQSVGREHSQLLDENIEYYHLMTRYNHCLDLLKVDDLDRLGDLILDTMMDLLSAEGGVLWLASQEGDKFSYRARRGLARLQKDEETVIVGESEQRLIREARAVLLQKGRYLYLPLLHESRPLAMIRMELPTGRSVFTARDKKVADLIAIFAASSLRYVLQIRELQRGSLRVAQKEAYNMAFFTDHASKELYKARRYNRRLSFMQLTIDNYEELKSKFLDREIEAGQQQLLSVVNEVLRDADIMAMYKDNIYHILLPETDYWGSLITQKRLRKAIDGQLKISNMKRDVMIDVYMRSASFPADGPALDELQRVSSARLDRLKSGLFYRSKLQKKGFWTIIKTLIGPKGETFVTADQKNVPQTMARYEAPGKSRYVSMPKSRLMETLKALCHEVTEPGRSRGVLFYGCPDFDEVRQALPNLVDLERSATSLFLLGGRQRVSWDIQRVVPIFVDEAHFQKTTFLLYLNEDYAYALFAESTAEGVKGFHTSDFYFVENMIAKLQDLYKLRSQI